MGNGLGLAGRVTRQPGRDGTGLGQTHSQTRALFLDFSPPASRQRRRNAERIAAAHRPPPLFPARPGALGGNTRLRNAGGTRDPRSPNPGSPDARGTRNGRPYAAPHDAAARRLNGAVFPGRGPRRPPLPHLRAELPTQNCPSWCRHAVAARLPEAAAPTGTPAGAAWARLATEPGAARPCAARGQTKDQLPPPPARGWSAGGPSPSAPPGS